MEKEIKPVVDKFVAENADKRLQEAKAEADGLTIKNEEELETDFHFNYFNNFNYFEEAQD